MPLWSDVGFWGRVARTQAGSFWGRQGLASRGALVGAGVGGIMGGFSDDSSFLGGALKGAALGAGIGHFGVPAFRAGAKAWGRSGGAAFGPRMGRVGRAVGWSMYAQGNLAARQIGNTARRGYNTFSTLGRGMMSGHRKRLAEI